MYLSSQGQSDALQGFCELPGRSQPYTGFHDYAPLSHVEIGP